VRSTGAQCALFGGCAGVVRAMAGSAGSAPSRRPRKDLISVAMRTRAIYESAPTERECRQGPVITLPGGRRRERYAYLFPAGTASAVDHARGGGLAGAELAGYRGGPGRRDSGRTDLQLSRALRSRGP